MFITGEIRESTPIYSEETGMAIIAAGHHRSEVFGVENIANWLTEIGVESEFIDIDNPI
jgi:putative NIF3 family GTP cyclohydrolase 1 type 2